MYGVGFGILGVVEWVVGVGIGVVVVVSFFGFVVIGWVLFFF